MNPQEAPQTLSVTQLNRLARQLLEDCFGNIAVSGELSTLSRPSSGHWYFTLKDSNAQIRCAFFRNRNMAVKFKPEAGQQVTVRGKISLYEARGDYQLIVDSMEPAGAGALAAAFEALKQELQAAGWFEQARKRPLPEHIQHIAVITSPTGAALHDIQAVLQRRWPAMRLSILPVLVQGEQAAGQISRAIAAANRFRSSGKQDFDLILLSRGGGSLEDLWPFNERSVARAIFDSELPVVSAVGHEVDFSISDFVADLRAPTPSAAAELLSPDQGELLSRLFLLRGRIEQAQQRRLKLLSTQLDQLRRRIRSPGSQLRNQAQRLDELEMRLQRQWQRQLAGHRQRLDHLERRQALLNPARRLRENRKDVVGIQQRLIKVWRETLNRSEERRLNLERRLVALGPQQTLNRGYSIIRDQQGHIIQRAQVLKAGQALHAKFAEGEASLIVAE